MNDAALGFRVKSGWAMVVLISASSPPRVIDRRRVDLSDPAVPASVQPFHAGLDLPKAVAAKAVARLVRCVERSSERAISELIEHYRAKGFRIVGAGIVVGSTVDPQTIRNDHIRAHAEEGRLFRVVIENVLKLSRLKSSVTREKDLIGEGRKMLGISEGRLRTELAKMGKAVEGSWRAEEKAATQAAMMALARWSRSRTKT
jgi:nucleoside diphosphate kinase